MWRSYYEGRRVRLACQTMEGACGQYGLSWWEGSRSSLHAARAALFFRKNTDDPRCLPELEQYYAIISKATDQKFDIRAAAALEFGMVEREAPLQQSCKWRTRRSPWGLRHTASFGQTRSAACTGHWKPCIRWPSARARKSSACVMGWPAPAGPCGARGIPHLIRTPSSGCSPRSSWAA
jgi:hypothetical protein